MVINSPNGFTGIGSGSTFDNSQGTVSQSGNSSANSKQSVQQSNAQRTANIYTPGQSVNQATAASVLQNILSGGQPNANAGLSQAAFDAFNTNFNLTTAHQLAGEYGAGSATIPLAQEQGLEALAAQSSQDQWSNLDGVLTGVANTAYNATGQAASGSQQAASLSSSSSSNIIQSSQSNTASGGYTNNNLSGAGGIPLNPGLGGGGGSGNGGGGGGGGGGGAPSSPHWSFKQAKWQPMPPDQAAIEQAVKSSVQSSTSTQRTYVPGQGEVDQTFTRDFGLGLPTIHAAFGLQDGDGKTIAFAQPESTALSSSAQTPGNLSQNFEPQYVWNGDPTAINSTATIDVAATTQGIIAQMNTASQQLKPPDPWTPFYDGQSAATQSSTTPPGTAGGQIFGSSFAAGKAAWERFAGPAPDVSAQAKAAVQPGGNAVLNIPPPAPLLNGDPTFDPTNDWWEGQENSYSVDNAANKVTTSFPDYYPEQQQPAPTTPTDPLAGPAPANPAPSAAGPNNQGITPNNNGVTNTGNPYQPGVNDVNSAPVNFVPPGTMDNLPVNAPVRIGAPTNDGSPGQDQTSSAPQPSPGGLGDTPQIAQNPAPTDNTPAQAPNVPPDATLPPNWTPYDPATQPMPATQTPYDPSEQLQAKQYGLNDSNVPQLQSPDQATIDDIDKNTFRYGPGPSTTQGQAPIEPNSPIGPDVSDQLPSNAQPEEGLKAQALSLPADFLQGGVQEDVANPSHGDVQPAPDQDRGMPFDWNPQGSAQQNASLPQDEASKLLEGGVQDSARSSLNSGIPNEWAPYQPLQGNAKVNQPLEQMSRPVMQNSSAAPPRQILQGGVRKQTVEGGITHNEELDPRMSIAWNQWRQNVHNLIVNHTQEQNPWKSAFDAPPRGTQVRYSVDVDRHGRIFNPKIDQSSGYQKFDSNVLSAVKHGLVNQDIRFPTGSQRDKVHHVDTVTIGNFTGQHHYFYEPSLYSGSQGYSNEQEVRTNRQGSTQGGIQSGEPFEWTPFGAPGAKQKRKRYIASSESPSIGTETTSYPSTLKTYSREDIDGMLASGTPIASNALVRIRTGKNGWLDVPTYKRLYFDSKEPTLSH